LFCKEGFWSYRGDMGFVDPDHPLLRDPKAILRDLDGDGVCEQILNTEILDMRQFPLTKSPVELPFRRLDAQGRDNGLRFVDLNGDGRADIVASNEREWGVWLFKDLQTGWERVASGKQGDPGSIPLITRNGTNNGAWFHSKHLWVQNEDTAKMKDLVDRRSFEELLRKN